MMVFSDAKKVAEVILIALIQNLLINPILIKNTADEIYPLSKILCKVNLGTLSEI